MASSGYNFLIPQGTIQPDTGEIQNEVAQEYKNAFNNQNLITTPNTPQGMLIAAETIARQSVLDNNAALANQFNPNVAGGIFLDALMSLLGSQRTPATSSTVNCTITGVAGTSIPAGSQISDSSGATVFELVATTVIPTGGTITGVAFQSVNTGPIAAPAHYLTTIVSNLLGWETVINPAAAILGVSTQSDTAARQQRLNTLAAQGTGLAEAITSGLFLTPGVTSLSFQENISSTEQTINDIPMAPHSLYACVAGTATNLAIAQTLTNTKSGGCAYNNGLGIPVSQPVVNPYSGQSIDVLFDLPSMVTISILATVRQSTSVQDAVTAVQNAILLYIAGGIPNIPGWGVGVNASPFQLAGAVNVEVPGLFVEEMQVGIQAFTTPGTLINGSSIVTGLPYTSAVIAGGTGIVNGNGINDNNVNIPPSTTVSSVINSSSVQMSNPATFPAVLSLTGTVAGSSASVTGLTSNTGIEVGMGISDGGVNIPANTIVLALVGSTGLTMSAQATGGATETLTFTPPAQFTMTGTISNGSQSVTGLSSNANIVVGDSITGTDIPAGTTVLALVGSTGLTMSQPATNNATETLTFTPANVGTATEVLNITMVPSYQTTEIPIGVWQQATTPSNASLITVTVNPA